MARGRDKRIVSRGRRRCLGRELLLVSAHEAWKSTNPSDRLVACHTTTGIDDTFGRAEPKLISTADHNVELVARLLLSCRQGVTPVAFAILPRDSSYLLLFAVSYLLGFRKRRKLVSTNGFLEMLTAVSLPTRTDERYPVIARHTRRNPRSDLNCWCHRS